MNEFIIISCINIYFVVFSRNVDRAVLLRFILCAPQAYS